MFDVSGTGFSLTIKFSNTFPQGFKSLHLLMTQTLGTRLRLILPRLR